MKIKELLVVEDSLPQFYVSHDCYHLSLSLSLSPTLALSISHFTYTTAHCLGGGSGLVQNR